jgi:hypothetical protein
MLADLWSLAAQERHLGPGPVGSVRPGVSWDDAGLGLGDTGAAGRTRCPKLLGEARGNPGPTPARRGAKPAPPGRGHHGKSPAAKVLGSRLRRCVGKMTAVSRDDRGPCGNLELRPPSAFPPPRASPWSAGSFWEGYSSALLFCCSAHLLKSPGRFSSELLQLPRHLVTSNYPELHDASHISAYP